MRANHGQLRIQAVSHNEDFNSLPINKFDVVINMASHPRYMRETYDESLDFDLRLARHVRTAACQYVMMSTRRVYGRSAPFPVDELTAPSPDDNYGLNKLTTERALQAILGDRCSILRVANVFDFEPGRHTFFGIALATLRRENRILLDVSPFVRRDFLHTEDFAQILVQVLDKSFGGILNLGSGRATELGRIALWLLEGYGQGQLVVSNPEERDNFELDITRLEALIGQITVSNNIRTRCIEIGGKLKNE